MVHVLVLSGYGINCEEETARAFKLAGGLPDIVHVNDLHQKNLSDYRIMAFPGGFSFGDDTGAGNALAGKLKNRIWPSLDKFAKGDNLVIGICNGFQVLVALGLLPALEGKYGEPQAALLHNDSARYIDRWVDVRFNGKSPWLRDIKQLSLPIAHGEGKFFASATVLEALKKKEMLAAKYFEGEICKYQNLPANPTGTLDNIAAITDESGRVLGMMPHPERAIDFTHQPNWPVLKEQYLRSGKPLPAYGPSLQLFQNAINYFR